MANTIALQKASWSTLPNELLHIILRHAVALPPTCPSLSPDEKPADDLKEQYATQLDTIQALMNVNRRTRLLMERVIQGTRAQGNEHWAHVREATTCTMDEWNESDQFRRFSNYVDQRSKMWDLYFGHHSKLSKLIFSLFIERRVADVNRVFDDFKHMFDESFGRT